MKDDAIPELPDVPTKDDIDPPGLVIEKTRTPIGKSSNPFDRLDLQDKALPPPPPLEQQSPMHATFDASAYNPFLQPQQPQASLEQSFQNLQVSQKRSIVSVPDVFFNYVNALLS